MITSPAEQFERELAQRLDVISVDRRSAVANAAYLESYVGGVTIHRRGDGWGCTSDDGAHDGATCDLPYDRDGAPLFEDMDFGMDTPDDHVTASVMNCDRWEELGPVADFINGVIDCVDLWSVKPAGIIDCDEDEDPYVDASDWIVLCADNGTTPRWEDDMPRQIVYAIHDLLDEHGELNAWPGSRDGETSIGDRHHELAVVRMKDGSAVIGMADGAVRNVLPMREPVLRALKDAVEK